MRACVAGAVSLPLLLTACAVEPEDDVASSESAQTREQLAQCVRQGRAREDGAGREIVAQLVAPECPSVVLRRRAIIAPAGSPFWVSHWRQYDLNFRNQDKIEYIEVLSPVRQHDCAADAVQDRVVIDWKHHSSNGLAPLHWFDPLRDHEAFTPQGCVTGCRVLFDTEAASASWVRPPNDLFGRQFDLYENEVVFARAQRLFDELRRWASGQRPDHPDDALGASTAFAAGACNASTAISGGSSPPPAPTPYNECWEAPTGPRLCPGAAGENVVQRGAGHRVSYANAGFSELVCNHDAASNGYRWQQYDPVGPRLGAFAGRCTQ